MSENKSLKRKITTKSLEEKYRSLKKIENGVAKKGVATKYGIPLNTLSTWVKGKEKISAAFKNGKSPKTMKLKGAGFDALGKAINKWFIMHESEMFLSVVPCLKRRQFTLQKSFRLMILRVLTAGSIAGKQGIASRLRRLVDRSWVLRDGRLGRYDVTIAQEADVIRKQ